MKSYGFLKLKNSPTVTPYAGVWIEILDSGVITTVSKVTPYAGVWIEIGAYSHGNRFYAVTPYAGVWIEIIIFFDTFSE